MTPRHNISLQSGAVPCRGYYDYYLQKMTPTDVLLASLREEDKKKKKKKTGTFLPGGGLAVRGDDGTSLLHNSGAPLNIIVMKMQSTTNTATAGVIVVLSSVRSWMFAIPSSHNPTSRLSLLAIYTRRVPSTSPSHSPKGVLFTAAWLILNPFKRNAQSTFSNHESISNLKTIIFKKIKLMFSSYLVVWSAAMKIPNAIYSIIDWLSKIFNYSKV